MTVIDLTKKLSEKKRMKEIHDDLHSWVKKKGRMLLD